MIGTVNTWLIIAGILIFIDVMSILSLALTRTRQDVERDINLDQKKAFVSLVSGKPLSILYKFDSGKYLKMKTAIDLSRKDKDRVEAWADIRKLERKYSGKLKRGLKVTRAEAAFALGRLGTKNARLALEKKLLTERNFAIKLFIANALSDIGHAESLPVLIHSLMGSSRFYRSRVNMLIADFGSKFHDLLPSLIDSEKEEIRELIIDFADVYYSEDLKNYLVQNVEGYINHSKTHNESSDNHNFQDQKSFIYSAAEILAKYYPKEMKRDMYFDAEDIELKKIAISALANYEESANIKNLLGFLDDARITESAIHAISTIVERNPIYLRQIVDCFFKEKNQIVRTSLAEILSLRMEYFIAQLAGPKSEESRAVIEEIVKLGNVSEITDYLNKNKDENIERELMTIVKSVAAQNPNVRKAFLMYLSSRLALQLGPRSIVAPEKEIKKSKDIKYLSVLFFLILLNFLIVPAIFAFKHQDILSDLSLVSGLRLFVKDFNYYFAYYSISINFVYFVLLILSFIHVRKQKKMWEIKDFPFLFKRKMFAVHFDCCSGIQRRDDHCRKCKFSFKPSISGRRTRCR